MSVIVWIVLIFSLVGALDRIFGNRFGLGREFERGFQLFGAMALSMIGMILLAPVLGRWMTPVFEVFYSIFHIDPSVLPALLFANDMGGASLAEAVCKDSAVGAYNAFVVSSMMGCVVSFTIPFASGIVEEHQHKELFFGFLCGIITIPIGCFVAGFLCKLTFLQIIVNLLPILLIAGILAVGIVFVPQLCVKIFAGFGTFMKILITIGLALGVITFLTGKTIFADMETLEAGAMICVNACVTLSGAFVFMNVVGRLLHRPMGYLGGKLGINATSALGFLPTLVTNATAYGMMRDMDSKGVVLNAAFSVSAAFVFGSHLGFTMSFDEAYVVPMIVGKLIAGVSAVVLAMLVYKPSAKEEQTA